MRLERNPLVKPHQVPVDDSPDKYPVWSLLPSVAVFQFGRCYMTV